jgi:membrane-associated phospholipid phosphatase
MDGGTLLAVQSVMRGAPSGVRLAAKTAGTPGAPIETAVLRVVQQGLGQPATIGVARALSLFGEHAAGWLAVGAVGIAADRDRRRAWLCATVAVAGAHGAAIAAKRFFRRRRPEHPDVRVHVSSPSSLSFPSSHATSTAAAAVLFGTLLERSGAGVVVLPMLVSRLVLGVHYPSDVIAGAALGGLIGALVRPAVLGNQP